MTTTGCTRTIETRVAALTVRVIGVEVTDPSVALIFAPPGATPEVRP